MESQFTQFEQSRSLKDLQPLYNAGIFLYEISPNGADTQRRTELNTEGKRLVKMYDKVNGKLQFTKILVY